MKGCVTIPVLAAKAMDLGHWRLLYKEYFKKKFKRRTTVMQRQHIAIRNRPYLLEDYKTLIGKGLNGI